MLPTSLDRVVVFKLCYSMLVKAHLPTNIYHIISISETWLYSSVSDDLMRLNESFLVRNDEEGRWGGGVAYYIRRSLQVRVLAASPSMFSNAPEYLILDIKCPNNESMLLTVMYRRPKGFLFSDFFNVRRASRYLL